MISDYRQANFQGTRGTKHSELNKRIMDNTLLDDTWHRIRAQMEKRKLNLILKYVCIAWIVVVIWVTDHRLVMRGKLFHTLYCSGVFNNIRISFSNWEGDKKQFRSCKALEFCQWGQKQRLLGWNISTISGFFISYPSPFLVPFLTYFLNLEV